MAAARRCTAARGLAPNETLGSSRVRRTERDDVADHFLAHDRRVDQCAGGAQILGPGDALHVVEGRGRDAAVGEAQHRGLVGRVRIADVDLGQEAVELRFGERVGAFVLDRVLRREHQEGVGERVGLTVDRHLALLHRFEERGLGLRRGPVDLVGEQEVREHRTGAEHELAAAHGHRAGEVGGEHVGGELHPAEVDDRRRARERVREQRLGDAGHTFEQEVTAHTGRGDHDVDDVILTDDDLAHLAYDAVSQFVHRRVLSSVTRATTRPSASTSSVIGRRMPQCHDLVVGETHLSRPRFRSLARSASAGSPARCLIWSRDHAPSGASAATESEVRSSVLAIAST